MDRRHRAPISYKSITRRDRFDGGEVRRWSGLPPGGKDDLIGGVRRARGGPWARDEKHTQVIGPCGSRAVSTPGSPFSALRSEDQWEKNEEVEGEGKKGEKKRLNKHVLQEVPECITCTSQKPRACIDTPFLFSSLFFLCFSIWFVCFLALFCRSLSSLVGSSFTE